MKCKHFKKCTFDKESIFLANANHFTLVKPNHFTYSLLLNYQHRTILQPSTRFLEEHGPISEEQLIKYHPNSIHSEVYHKTDRLNNKKTLGGLCIGSACVKYNFRKYSPNTAKGLSEKPPSNQIIGMMVNNEKTQS